MRSRIIAVVLLALLLIAGKVSAATPTPNGSQAADAPGCEGLSAYQTAMLQIGRTYAQELREIGFGDDTDVTTLSSDDWSALADVVLEINRAIRAIGAPEWIDPWHQVTIDELGLIEQMALAASSSGLFATILFSEKQDELEAKEQQIAAEVIGHCFYFRGFLSAWETSGTEQSTPIASPSN
jgi:hypothetical protein